MFNLKSYISRKLTINIDYCMFRNTHILVMPADEKENTEQQNFRSFIEIKIVMYFVKNNK